MNRVVKLGLRPRDTGGIRVGPVVQQVELRAALAANGATGSVWVWISSASIERAHGPILVETAGGKKE